MNTVALDEKYMLHSILQTKKLRPDLTFGIDAVETETELDI